MDSFQEELMEMARAAQTGNVRAPGDDPFKIGEDSWDNEDKSHPNLKDPKNPLSKYSHEEIMAFYEQIKEGNVPPEIAAMQ